MTQWLNGHTALLALALVGIAPNALAAEPTKKECIEANAQAQSQQRGGKLKAAEASLMFCATSSCPGVLRDDCALRLDELKKKIPSVIFEVKSALGADIAVVRVQMDGQLIAEKLDGSALSVDPGEHTFSFEIAGEPPAFKKLVVAEGQRGRRESIVIGTTPPSSVVPPKAATGTAVAPLPPAKSGNGQRTFGVVLGIAGLAGLGAGGALGLLANSSASSAKTNCETAANCQNHTQAVSDHADATSFALGSTIAVIAGAAVLGTGLVLYLTAPRSRAHETAMRLQPTLGGALFSGNF